MDPVTRRKFIQTSSVAAVGAALAGPVVLAASNNRSDHKLRSASATAAPAAGVEDVPVDGSVVAHVVDAASGQISLFVGTREVTIRDRELASRLLAATR